jgi:hypothetical protein
MGDTETVSSKIKEKSEYVIMNNILADGRAKTLEFFKRARNSLK